jgi:hypothetical protein
MTDFPTGMPVIARDKWFRGMTLIPGYGAVGCNPQEHPAADVPIRPDLAHRPGLPVRNGSRSAGKQPRPVTFVPRAETSKGRLPL